jgi:hypothetical protein
MRIRGVFALATAVAFAGCDSSLDLTNPNSPPEEQVTKDVNGVIALGVGVQQQFSQALDDYLVPNGLVTDEWGTTSKSLISYQSLVNGNGFSAGFGIVNDPFALTYQTARTANTVVASSGSVGLAPEFQAGLNATARLFKAMALGQAAQLFQTLPVDVGQNAAPQPRTVVMDTALMLLEQARSDIANVTDAQLAGVRSRVLGSGINLRATIDAMLARYYLFRGQYQQAIDAANRVPANATSTLTYPAPTVNPVTNLTQTSRLGYVSGLASFVAQAQPGDKRPAYWLATGAATVRGNPDSLMYNVAKYTGPNDPYPLFLPDEIKLIKAEAYARLGNLPQARTLINEVRTQTTATVDEPVAGLPALPDAQLADLNAVLTEIAYERRYELYMQGMRWEDTRRLPQPWTNTVVMPFLPTPTLECQANPSSSC